MSKRLSGPITLMSVLCDYFKSHSSDEVTSFTNSTVNQPLDETINCVFKANLRDCYDQWSLIAPITPTTGVSFSPSRQMIGRWFSCQLGCLSIWKSELGHGGEIIHYPEDEKSLMVQIMIGDNAVILET